MMVSRNPVNRNKLPGSKWTATRPERREKHWLVLDWERDADGRPTDRVRLEAVMTRRVRLLHWRELGDAGTWRVGWR